MRTRPGRRPGPFVSPFATVVVKPRGGQRADSLANALRRDVQKADPNLPLYFVGTPRSQLDIFVAQNRIVATMFTIFGAVAIVLASVGIYGVMSFAVNQRTQEFGVRMALGANGRRILQMVVRQGVVQIAIGLVLVWAWRWRSRSPRPMAFRTRCLASAGGIRSPTSRWQLLSPSSHSWQRSSPPSARRAWIR
jgi:hypothetical protein